MELVLTVDFKQLTAYNILAFLWFINLQPGFFKFNIIFRAPQTREFYGRQLSGCRLIKKYSLWGDLSTNIR